MLPRRSRNSRAETITPDMKQAEQTPEIGAELHFGYFLCSTGDVDLVQIYIGCSGWSYSAWLGHFYPAKTESRHFLEYYSKVFDYVEIENICKKYVILVPRLQWK